MSENCSSERDETEVTVLRRDSASTTDEAPSRRRFLVAGAAGAAAVGLAGCLGEDYEDDYEQAQTDLEETEDELSQVQEELDQAQEDLEQTQAENEELSRNHVVLTGAFVASEGEVDSDFDRFSRENSPETVFVQGAPVGFAVGIYEANTGEPVESGVDEAVVTIPDLEEELALTWHDETETWQAVLEETGDLEAGTYEFSVDVSLEGEAIHVGTSENEFEIVEVIVETHAVEYVDSQDSVSGLDGSATIDVPENQVLLVAGEEEGWDLPFNCRVGRCGRCAAKTDVEVDGVVEMRENHVLPDELIAEGYFLTCQGEPRDEFTLETDVYNDIKDQL